MDANVNGDAAEKPKKKQVQRVFNEEDLCQKQEGLNSLYTKFVIEKVPLKGKGHEINDLNRIMSVYSNWHIQFAPKLQFDYAFQKVSKLSGKKGISEHMRKLRDVYKGESELFFEVQQKADRI